MMASDNEKIRDLDDTDTDVSIGVSPNLYDRSFDELITEYVPLSADESAHIWWYVAEALPFTALLRYIKRGVEASFGAITQTALAHGFVIFQHRYKEIIDLVENLDDTAVANGNERFLSFSDTYITRPRGEFKRLQTRTDNNTSEHMGEIAATLRISKSYLAMICIMLSLQTSALIPPKSREIVERHIADFDTRMQLKRSYTLSLLEI